MKSTIKITRAMWSHQSNKISKSDERSTRLQESCEVKCHLKLPTFVFQPANEVTVQEVLKCALKIFLGDPSSLPRTANLLEILGSVTVSYTFF